MAKVLVALLRFSPKQQKELLRKVDEQVNQVSYLTLHLGEWFMACRCTVEIFCTEHFVMTDSTFVSSSYIGFFQSRDG